MEGLEQVCRRCDRVLAPEARVCLCGTPTGHASFKERAEHEVREWRAYKARMQQQTG